MREEEKLAHLIDFRQILTHEPTEDVTYCDGRVYPLNVALFNKNLSENAHIQNEDFTLMYRKLRNFQTEQRPLVDSRSWSLFVADEIHGLHFFHSSRTNAELEADSRADLVCGRFQCSDKMTSEVSVVLFMLFTTTFKSNCSTI